MLSPIHSQTSRLICSIALPNSAMPIHRNRPIMSRFGEAATQGFARAWWCGDAACEDKVKDDIKATNPLYPSRINRAGVGLVLCAANPQRKSLSLRELIETVWNVKRNA